ncbi:hypothetical protein VMCG_07967 [Cytospora schulzeri]|uniref:Uncharacterized protein n=1 Tax=Cytospora schulzeri TaxID=448051 RepID=A0A423VY86_9PEZI|nr:hypothetical protein VMCG_07967 [Valsa malicola]
MTATTARPHSLRTLAILLLSSRVQALGRFHARDDLVGPPGGFPGWPGYGHGHGHGHDNGNGDGEDDGGAVCSCPQPTVITTSSIPGFETDLPLQTVTTTVTVPGPTVTSPGSTVTVPASTVTIPGVTVTIPGSIAPATQATPDTVTITGPSITVPSSSGFLNEGLNGGNLGPSITVPASSSGETPLVPTACGPQTIIETVFTTVTSTLAWPRHRQ